ncbi:hypothetical protein [Mucilaginibacter sp. SG564]|uniref:hypothetical protein n=1 Tax=Mucilaginibacter sp. SG564 TaxID=2587022 RepID=UPI0015560D69|nr:hypothetical protein [Mucilaginibacter sp. SG564]NOW94971.1 hypothetical protein [Mucilaginibacter sp. SG564]
MRVFEEAIFDGVEGQDDLVPRLMQLFDRKDSIVFSGQVMSAIIKDAMEHYVAAEAPPDLRQFGKDLFQAILAYNQHFYDQDFTMTSFADLFISNIQQQFYIRRETYLKLNTLLKFTFISKFLTDDEKLKAAAQEYCAALEIGTVWKLASFILHMFRVIHAGDKQSRHILDRNGAQWPVLEQFVMSKADLTKGALSLHKQVIPKPFYQLEDGRLILLDYNYFSFGLDQGIFYSLYHKSSLVNGIIFKNYNDYQGYLGLKYFEEYYIGRFIQKIFSKWNHRIVHTEKYQDYIVSAGNQVFVFEIKMTEFNANGLDRSSFEDFKDFVDRNFLAFKQSGQKAKGLGQLVRQIGHLANDQELMDSLGIKKRKRLQVYPIIIYSDANLDINGVNEYVNEQWLERTATYLNAFLNIRPITMINGSILMTYYYLLRKDPALFGQWLNDYIKSVNNLKKRYHNGKDPFDYLEYNRSFAAHMRRKIPKYDFDTNLTALQTDFDLETNAPENLH